MQQPKIELVEGGVRLTEVEVVSQELRSFLERVPEDDWEQVITRALDVGVAALERVWLSEDLDFVRKEVHGFLRDVEKEVGRLPREIEEAVRAKLGTDDGQALAPVKHILEAAERSTTVSIGKLQELIARELDPDKGTSALGKTLTELKGLLDPDRVDSVQGRLSSSVRDITGKDGRLAEAVRDAVEASLKPLNDQVGKLSDDLHEMIGAEGVIATTTLSGAPFEQRVFHQLQRAFSLSGCSVEWTGPQNLQGDVLLDFRDDQHPLRIIVEAKSITSGAKGRKVIGDIVEVCMEQFDASAAVFVTETDAGLAREIGDWYEGSGARGRWIATTFENLLPAVRLLRVMERQARSIGLQDVDPDGVKRQLEVIQNALGDVANVKKKMTDVKKSADDGRDLVESMRRSILDALTEIEVALGIAPTASAPEPTAVVTGVAGDGAGLSGESPGASGSGPLFYRDPCRTCGEPIEKVPGKRGRPPVIHTSCH